MIEMIETGRTLSLDERANVHPCYSRPAAHTHARIHLPVAPGCNVQCNYCRREFDCVNESRPGVASKILSVDEALNRVKNVYERLPNLSVVGIAGPGDALATPHQTFKTFEAVRASFPNMKFCLATNGLTLPHNLDALIDHNVEFVTVTVNSIDPAVGQHIYAWIYDSGIVYRGKKAADLLWSRQRDGIHGLVKRGVLVKVNTVLIPGINDSHVVSIASEANKLGAHMLNVISLIPVPSTSFSNIRPVSTPEYEDIIRACSEHIYVMRHCQRCRADAAGLLGESIGAIV